MNGRRALGAPLSALMLALACTAYAQLPNPVLEPEQPWAFDGFVIEPPREGEWFSLTKTRARAAFARQPDAGGATLVAAVAAERIGQRFESPAALLAWLRERRGKATDSRYVPVLHDEWADADDAQWCTRYRLKSEDRQSLLSAVWFVEVIGRSCWHREAGVVVDVSVSERTLAGAPETKLDAVGERFVRSLRLTPLTSEGRVALERALAHDRTQEASSAQEAERWYRIAAAAGEVDALYNLGTFYDKGRTGTRNAEEAVKWFRRAADQRDRQAQLNLGLLYYKGDGVPRDPQQASLWLSLAAGNGSERAKALLRELRFEEE